MCPIKKNASLNYVSWEILNVLDSLVDRLWIMWVCCAIDHISLAPKGNTVHWIRMSWVAPAIIYLHCTIISHLVSLFEAEHGEKCGRLALKFSV